MKELAGPLGMPAHTLTTWGRLCWCAIGEDHGDDAFAVDEDDLAVGWGEEAWLVRESC